MQPRPEFVAGHPVAGPTIVIPADDALQQEPAEVIAKAMELKKGILGVLAISGVFLAPELDTNIDIIIQGVIVLAYAGYAVYGSWRQGQQTRQAVFSPASTAHIAELAAHRGSVNVIDDDEHARPKVV